MEEEMELDLVLGRDPGGQSNPWRTVVQSRPWLRGEGGRSVDERFGHRIAGSRTTRDLLHE